MKSKVEEQALQGSEQRYRALLELAPDAVLVHQDGRIVYVNAAALKLFGARSLDELLGRESLELAHPEEREIVLARRRQVLQNGGTLEPKQMRLVRLDGREVVGETAVAKVNWLGRPAIQLIVRDITERKRVEVQLRRNEAIYRAMAQSVPGGAMSVVDHNLRYVVVEGVLLAQLGLSQQTMIGHTAEEVFAGETGRTRTEHFRRALAGEASSYETEYQGRIIWSQFVPLRDQQGQVMAAMSLAIDVTEFKQVEEALRQKSNRLRLLSEAAGQLLAGQAPELTVQELFDKMAHHMDLDAYFSFHLDDSSQSLLLDTWGGIPEPVARSLARLQLGQGICGTAAQRRCAIVLNNVQHSPDPLAEFVRPLGLQAYTCFPLLVGERLVGTLSFGSRRRQEFTREDLEILRTISFYVAVAREQTQRRRDLERTVEERTTRLQEMVAELEHMSYSMVHSMRAPLRAIEGSAVLIQRAEAERLRPQSRELLSRMEIAIHQMDELITDALNYNKAVRRRLPICSVEVEGVLRNVLETYSELQPPRAKVCLTGPFPPLQANAVGLTQCLAELLRNGVKFVPPGRLPYIKVWAEPVHNSPGWVRLWVEDNGTGIPKDWQSRIFELFQRLHGPDYPGTGLGLALVRKLTERMGGRVGVESEPGRGSRFWLEFKAAS